jgi:hypothetical protein
MGCEVDADERIGHALQGNPLDRPTMGCRDAVVHGKEAPTAQAFICVTV